MAGAGEALSSPVIVRARGYLQPPAMPAIEFNTRMHLHDLFWPNHEKCQKTMVTFPPRRLRDCVVNVLRVDYWGLSLIHI